MSSKRKRQSARKPHGDPRRIAEEQAARAWQPMQQVEVNPEYMALALFNGGVVPAAAFTNDIYQVTVQTFGDPENPVFHLSIKRHDRLPIHDWRHLQAIKNEIVGPDRLAVEIYPEEHRLVDTSNQYHLWVPPLDYELPFGFHEYMVSSDAQVKIFNAERERGDHKGRQREFQYGLPVAKTRNEQDGADVSMHVAHGLTHSVRTPQS